MKQFLQIILTAITVYVIFDSCNKKKEETFSYANGIIVSEWNHTLTEAIEKDLFSPPVASRIYAYSNIAAYEAIRFSSPDFKSFAGQLNGLEKLPEPGKEIVYDFTIAGMISFTTVAKKLVYTEKVIDDYQKYFLDSVSKTGEDKNVIDSSVAFGKQIADVILKWASKDNFRKTRGEARYVLLHKADAWEPTPPDYMPAVEPHWNEIRPFVLPKASFFIPDSLPVPFSSVKNSEFYKNAMAVYSAVNNLDSNQRSMSVFWDCNPNVSTLFGHLEVFNQKMTPGGHWIAIVSLVVKKNKLDMIHACEGYSLTGVAIADAFIACWDAKYSFQTIRPVTYINRYIDAKWNPLLQTPPFPEFPSGHSTISAAAATVLTHLYGTDFAFTDSSEVPYGLPVRSFHSFKEAADEVAVSRFYGGIHFAPSNESGKIIGRKTGELVVEKVVLNR